MTADDVRALIRVRAAAFKSVAAWCRDVDLTPQLVSDFLNRRRGPEPRLLQALGLEAVVQYRATDNTSGGPPHGAQS